MTLVKSVSNISGGKLDHPDVEQSFFLITNACISLLSNCFPLADSLGKNTKVLPGCKSQMNAFVLMRFGFAVAAVHVLSCF